MIDSDVKKQKNLCVSLSLVIITFFFKIIINIFFMAHYVFNQLWGICDRIDT